VRKVKHSQGWDVFLSDLALFFLKIFLTFFSGFSNSQKVRVRG
jgi:hypothetical protein